jgi:bifunctional UDP-N-acetylglucosamine pyrophosphorylase/glucosamine-1-phosphate N-acetyltransferase
MHSRRPKVAHELAGCPMLFHVLAMSRQVTGASPAIVLGPDMNELAENVKSECPAAQIFIQNEQLGTAHAVLSAKEAFADFRGNVLVLYGDTPLLQPATLHKMLARLNEGSAVNILGFRARDPLGYGRILTRGEEVLAVREHKDAGAEELQVTFCNSGVMAFRGEYMESILARIDNNNASGEYYLTDAVEFAKADGLQVTAVECPEEEVLGINSRAQLAVAESVIQNRLRQQAMQGGATLIAPETVFLGLDTRLGRDVLVEPHVFFGPGVSVGDNVIIRAFSHIEQASIADGATVGPYARLRPGADIGKGAKVGNFVEIKSSVVAKGAKVSHLSYIGDTEIGQRANIGAGTITCNYDGFAKHKTIIGDEAFIGSNSSLVAPLKIDDGAYVGSGSVITKNVSKDALAVSRARQTEREEWAARYRRMRSRKDQA